MKTERQSKLITSRRISIDRWRTVTPTWNTNKKFSSNTIKFLKLLLKKNYRTLKKESSNNYQIISQRVFSIFSKLNTKGEPSSARKGARNLVKTFLLRRFQRNSRNSPPPSASGSKKLKLVIDAVTKGGRGKAGGNKRPAESLIYSGQ